MQAERGCDYWLESPFGLVNGTGEALLQLSGVFVTQTNWYKLVMTSRIEKASC